jgi:uncharacterized protein YabE (DUF348 family)
MTLSGTNTVYYVVTAINGNEAVAPVTPAHDRVISLGTPVATAVNVAGTESASNISKSTVAIAL